MGGDEGGDGDALELQVGEEAEKGEEWSSYPAAASELSVHSALLAQMCSADRGVTQFSTRAPTCY